MESTNNEIIDDMLSKRNEVNSLDIETLGTIMPSSFSPRKLFMLDDFEIEKFISSDFDVLMIKIAKMKKFLCIIHILNKVK